MKNRIEELAIGTTTDVTVITPKVIAGAIEEIARGKVIWAQFFKTNRDLMTNGGTEVVFPKKGSGVSASWGLSAGGSLSATAMSFSGVTIAVTKGGVGIGLYGEAIRQSNRDVLADCINEGGNVWAETIDTAAFEAMFPLLTVNVTGGGTFVAATLGVLAVKSVNPSTITGLTIVNIAGSSSITAMGAGTIAASTISYWSCPGAASGKTIAYNTVTAAASSIQALDIGNLKAAIVGNKFSPAVLMVNPARVPEIVNEAAKSYIIAAQPGYSPIYTGEVANLWGMRVIVSPYVPKYSVVALDPEKVGWQVIRKELDMQRDPYTGMNIDALYFWGFAEKGFGVVNDKAYGAMHIKGTYAIDVGLGFP